MSPIHTVMGVILSTSPLQNKGILYMLLASCLFAFTMLFAKLLSHSMGSVEVTFWRNSIGLLVIVPTLLHHPMRNIGGRPFILVFRGIAGTVALLMFFYMISATSLSSAIVYAKTEPIFTAFLAFFLLKERLRPSSIMAIVIGFLGVIIINKMQWNYLHIMGILTGFLSALAYTSVRSLGSFYDSRTIVLSFMISGTLIPLVLMSISPYYSSDVLRFALNPFVIPTSTDWIWILSMGVTAAIGQVLMTKAYFHAKAGIVSSMSYSVIVFATLLGVIIGDTLPTSSIWFGTLLIVVSGIILARNTNKKDTTS